MRCPSRSSNNQGRFHPSLISKVLRQVFGPHHRKKRKKRGITLFENDGAPPNNRELSISGCNLDSFGLIFRKYRKNAGKQSAPIQVFRSCSTIVSYRSTNLESTGDLLRMVSMNSSTQRKVGGAPQN